MQHKMISLILALFILSACSPVATGTPAPVISAQPSDLIPSPSDSNSIRAEVYLSSADLLTMESFPLQFSLNLKGDLPSPCHNLRVSVSLPDTNNQINVDVYSIINPAVDCAQVLQPFEVNMPLGSYPSGHYKLFVNGKLTAEFDA
jgi:hypothetical protein